MKHALVKSLLIHLAVIILFLLDLPFFSSRPNADEFRQVPIIVNLNDVKISEMTNLPPKAKMGEEDKQAVQKKQKEERYTQEPPREEPQPVPPQIDEKKQEPAPEKAPDVPEEKPLPPKQDFLEAPKPENKPKQPEKKPVVTPPPKKPQPPKQETPPPKKVENKKTPELANPLKSLLASVDEIEKNIGKSPSEATIKDGTAVQNMGIEGGTGGSYFSELSISEVDAIAGRLRACWNLDPGAMGIENMVVEIRAFLNRDGTVKEARILDTSRYSSDPHFRSVADSARRAVYICAPYSILSEKYADKYDMWSTMKLRFNPLDGKVN